jgi:hypothetical protein
MTTDGHDHVDPAQPPDADPGFAVRLGAEMTPDAHAAEAQAQEAAAAAIEAGNDATCRALGQPTDAELLAMASFERVEPYTGTVPLAEVTATDKSYITGWAGSGWAVDQIDREVRARGGITRAWIGCRDVADQIQVYREATDPDTPVGTPITLRPGEWLAYNDGVWAVAPTASAAQAAVRICASDAEVLADHDPSEGTEWDRNEVTTADVREAMGFDLPIGDESASLADELTAYVLRQIGDLEARTAAAHANHVARDTTAARRAARAQTREVCETVQAITITAVLPVACVLGLLVLLRVLLWMG